MPGFWDAMTPAYRRLPPPVPFVPTVSVDNMGQALIVGVTALTMAHGGATIVRSRVSRAKERRATKAAAGETERGGGAGGGSRGHRRSSRSRGRPRPRKPDRAWGA